MRKQFSRGLQTLGKSTLSLLATGFLALWSTTIWTLLMHDSERPLPLWSDQQLALFQALPPETVSDWEGTENPLLTCPQNGWKTTPG